MGTTTNLALNKPAASSSYVMPYVAANAVNGTLVPISRWLCNTLPGWMSVDLQATYRINRWVVRHMGVAGWQSPSYNMSDFKLQASADNKVWYDLDSVVGNTASITDRTFANPANCRYVRVYVSKGLNCDPQLASIMEFEIYPAPLSSYLTGITLSSGTLSPSPFAGNTTFAYTASVGYDVSSITLTPVAEDVNAIIKVNGSVVKSNTASASIPLSVGANSITVLVTAADGTSQHTYTVTATRAGSQYLSALTLSSGTLSPTPFAGRTTFAYTSTVSADVESITLTPTAEYANSTITVNGVAVTSGSASGAINLSQINNTITVVVTDTITGIKQTYTITVTRNLNLYLTKVDLSYSGRGYTGNGTVNMDHTNLNYTTNTSTKASQVIVKPYAEDVSVVINVNGQNIVSGNSSTAISLPNASNPISIKVSYSGTTDSRDYVITIVKS